MPMRSLTQLCQWHCGAWLSCFNTKEESDSAVSMTLWSLAQRFQYQRRVGLSCVNDTVELDSAVSMPTRSLTQLCQWHCGAWLSGINANEESDSAVSMILRSLTPKYGVRPRGLSIMYLYEHWKLPSNIYKPKNVLAQKYCVQKSLNREKKWNKFPIRETAFLILEKTTENLFDTIDTTELDSPLSMTPRSQNQQFQWYCGKFCIYNNISAKSKPYSEICCHMNKSRRVRIMKKILKNLVTLFF